MKILYDEDKDLLSVIFKDEDGDRESILGFDEIGLLVNHDKQVIGFDVASASAHVDLSAFAIDLEHNLGDDEL